MPAVGIWDGATWQPIQGLQGVDGTDGQDGATGPQGDKGDQGDVGPPGPSSVSTDANNQATLGSDQLIYVPEPVIPPSAGWDIFAIFNAQNGNISGIGPGNTIAVQGIVLPPVVGDEYMIQYNNSTGLIDSAATAQATFTLTLSFDGGSTIEAESELQVQTDNDRGRSIAALAVVGQAIATGGNLEIRAEVTSDQGSALSNPSRGFGTTTIWSRTP